MSDGEANYLDTLPHWPLFGFGDKGIDGLLPVTKVTCWRGYQNALSNEFFHRSNVDLIYRGHRRHEWQLTPTLGRYAESGVIQPAQVARQLEEFRRASRGRGARFSKEDDENELWSYGQHHGLATPLLDWTKSPFVALFFAFADADPDHEKPNPSQPIFILNKTALEVLDDELVVQPLRSDHTRLINQAGLFTISPRGEKTLITHIMDLLAESKIDMDDPVVVAKYICKIHVPCTAEDRLLCVRALKMINIHHGTLFPDAVGASLFCNEWVGSQTVKATANDQPIASSSTPRVAPEPHSDPAEARPRPADLIALLDGVAPSADAIIPDNIAVIARQISAVCDEHAGPDWHRRPSNEADLRLRVRRVLRLAGWEHGHANAVSSIVLDYFRPASTPS